MKRKKDEQCQKKRENLRWAAGSFGNTTDSPAEKTISTPAVLLAVLVLLGAVLFGVYLLNIIPAAPATETGSDNVTVYFFYGKECLHCHTVTPYVESLQEKYPDIEFRILEIWHDKTNNALYELLNHRLGREPYGVPQVIIGRVSLLGEDKIRAGLETAILGQKGNLTGSSQQGAVPSYGSFTGLNDTITAIFFYGNGCSHCENIKPLITEIRTRHPELSLEMLEINENKTNREKFLAMNIQYGVSGGGIPTIFIGENALIGETEIRNHFEERVLAEKQRTGTGTRLNLTPPDTAILQEVSVMSPYLVVFAALADSTNPCGLAVLVFLLISMAAAGGRKRILLAGGAYTAATFLFHLLVGIGLFSVFSLSGLSKLFSVIGGVIALLFGIINIADLLRNKETFFLSISESHKSLLGDYARKASIPAAFVLGILAGILGFTCTGGIYISILGLMGRDMTAMTGLGWLVLYNLIYVLPLVLITVLAAYGVSPERADKLRTRHKRLLRVLISVILISLGAIILFGWMG